MTREQINKLVAEMDGLLELAKEYKEKESDAKTRTMYFFEGMKRTLVVLGYEVEVDEENCTVTIK